MSEFRGSFFKQPPPEKRPKAMRSRSERTAERDARYTVERAVFLEQFPWCQADWSARCTKAATEVHHMAGRAPAVFFRKDWWLPVCHYCHEQITRNPEQAFESGLSFHRHGEPVR